MNISIGRCKLTFTHHRSQNDSTSICWPYDIIVTHRALGDQRYMHQQKVGAHSRQPHL